MTTTRTRHIYTHPDYIDLAIRYKKLEAQRADLLAALEKCTDELEFSDNVEFRGSDIIAQARAAIEGAKP